MSQYLPTGEFQWLNDDEVVGLDVTNIADDGERLQEERESQMSL